jgi:hypothetical protein
MYTLANRRHVKGFSVVVCIWPPAFAFACPR